MHIVQQPVLHCPAMHMSSLSGAAQGQGFPDNELEGPESMKKVVARCGWGSIIHVPGQHCCLVTTRAKHRLHTQSPATASLLLSLPARCCPTSLLMLNLPFCCPTTPCSSLYEHSNQYPPMMGVLELRQVSSRWQQHIRSASLLVLSANPV